MKYKNVFINDREISCNNPPYIIAEISANHNGSIKRAIKTINAAKDCGVDAVKIQTYTPDTMTIDSLNDDFKIDNGLWKGRTLYELYGEAFTPFEWHKELFDHANKIGITLFSSPFDESAVDLLESLNVPAYKVASFEIIDLPLIKYIAKTLKPIVISTGMASINEIKDAIETAKINGCKDLILLHCISSYPTPLNEANLKAINRLKKEFKVEVGISDHTIGYISSIVATSLGASVIEKHFTLSRSEGGVDSSFSLEPSEMRVLVNNTRLAHLTIKSNSQIRSSCEDDNKIFRRSLYFVNDVNIGEKITKSHIKRIRPGFGLEPKYYDNVIGSICTKKAKRGDRVTFEHFKSDNLSI